MFWIYICYSALTKSILSPPLSSKKHETLLGLSQTIKTIQKWNVLNFYNASSLQTVTLILTLGDNNQAELDLTYLR